jgi:putative transposase
VGFSLSSERVIRSLERIIEWRGRPDRIRCDNGPEYVSAAFMAWANRLGIHGEFIQPGKPQQNAYIERYNRIVRYWLAHYLFDSIEEVQEFATRWLWTYNLERPDMAIGGITPKQKLVLAAWLLLSGRFKNGGDYLTSQPFRMHLSVFPMVSALLNLASPHFIPCRRRTRPPTACLDHQAHAGQHVEV